MRFQIARATAGVSTWALKHVFRRPAANFPGKFALYVDPDLVAHLAPRAHASICVVGTNGKTTVTNLLADSLEAAGQRVICNRTGANLDSGVTTALLQAHVSDAPADWGVFECDELWLAKITPGLQPRFVLLLNLFRDQLDRVGEIDHIQESIAGALAASPGTLLIYNADDPLCQAIADRVDNRAVPFGLADDLGLPQNIVADARMCQRCQSMLDYDWRQYGQLGNYHCPNCGFTRAEPEYAATDVHLTDTAVRFTFVASSVKEAGAAGGAALTNTAAPSGGAGTTGPVLESHLAGTYMVYNLLSVATAADMAGVPIDAVQRAISAFDPHNGRLEAYDIDGRPVLLNLAKNPTGFNQNLNIVLAGEGPKSVAFFINDKEADGHDVSWLWDIDFQNLSEAAASGELAVFAGGLRRNDMQVRLKYAGIQAPLVDGAADFLAQSPAGARAYIIANYTALPGVKATLDHLAETTPLTRDDTNQVSVIGSAASRGSLDSALRAPLGMTEDAPAQAGRVSNPVSDTRVDPTSADKCVDGPMCRGELPLAQAPQAPHAPTGTNSALTRDDTNPVSVIFTIVHLFPTLLNLYGDNGNVTVLAERARRHGLDVRIVTIDQGERPDWTTADIVFLGGGPDREQRLAADFLEEMADDLRKYIADDGVLLAICGGFQIIGREWLMGDETVPGLGILGVSTQRADGGSHNRLVGNITLASPLAEMPVVGYENHAGRTFLDPGVEPFGTVVGQHGHGNNDRDHADGAIFRNVVGSYLHGPLLAKNPEVADALIARALERRGITTPLGALDDTEERAANAYMRGR